MSLLKISSFGCLTSADEVLIHFWSCPAFVAIIPFKELMASCFALASSYKCAISAGKFATGTGLIFVPYPSGGDPSGGAQILTIMNELLQHTGCVLSHGHLRSF